MGRLVAIAEIVRMLRDCAPDATLVVRTHCIQVKRGARFAEFAKGPGIPKRPEDARGQEHERVVRRIVKLLNLDAVCIERHFPDLVREGTLSSYAA